MMRGEPNIYKPLPAPEPSEFTFNTSLDFSLDRMSELLKTQIVKIEEVKDKEVVLVIGDMGAGKSTLVNVLTGKELVEIKKFGEVLLEVADTTSINTAKIGHGKETCTEYATVYKGASGTGLETSPILYCDTNGFRDNRDYEERSCGSILRQATIYSAKTIRAIIVVIDYNTLGVTRGDDFQNLVTLLSDLLKAPKESPIIYVFSKIYNIFITHDDLLARINDHLSFVKEKISKIEDKLKGFQGIKISFDTAKRILKPNNNPIVERLIKEFSELKAVEEILESILVRTENVFLMRAKAEQDELKEGIIKRLVDLSTIIPTNAFNFNTQDNDMRHLEETLIRILRDTSLAIDTHQRDKSDLPGLSEEQDRLKTENSDLDQKIDDANKVTEPIVEFNKELRKKEIELERWTTIKREIDEGMIDAQIIPPINSDSYQDDEVDEDMYAIKLTTLKPPDTVNEEKKWGIRQYQNALNEIDREDLIYYASATPKLESKPSWYSFLLFWEFSQEMSYTGLIDGAIFEADQENGSFMKFKVIKSQISDDPKKTKRGNLSAIYKYKPSKECNASVTIQLQKKNIPANQTNIMRYKAQLTVLNDKSEFLKDKIKDVNESIQIIKGNIKKYTDDEKQKSDLKKYRESERSKNSKTIEENEKTIKEKRDRIIKLENFISDSQLSIDMVLKIADMIPFEFSFKKLLMDFRAQYIEYLSKIDPLLGAYFNPFSIEPNKLTPKEWSLSEASDQYELPPMDDNLLGKGSFGRVYAVQEKKTGRWLALKKLSVAKDTDINTVMSEIKALKAVKLPDAIGFYGYFFEGDRSSVSLVLELALCSLDQILFGHNERLPWSLLLQFMKQIFNAVWALHILKIVHCDLKPENILISQNLVLVIADFGLAVVNNLYNSRDEIRSASLRDANPKGLTGTVKWAAPEAFDGICEMPGDMFSLGLIAWVIATQKILYEGLSFKPIYKKRFEPVEEYAGLIEMLPLDVPPIFKLLIENCSRAMPDQRWTAAKAKAELECVTVEVTPADVMKLSNRIKATVPEPHRRFYPVLSS